MADMSKAFQDGFAAQDAAPAEEPAAEPMMDDADMRCPMCGASAGKIVAAQEPKPKGGMMGGGMGGGGMMGK